MDLTSEITKRRQRIQQLTTDKDATLLRQQQKNQDLQNQANTFNQQIQTELNNIETEIHRQEGEIRFAERMLAARDQPPSDPDDAG